MSRPFYLSRFSAEQLDRLAKNLRVCVRQVSPQLANWLAYEIEGEQLRRERNTGRKIPREPTPLEIPKFHKWRGASMAKALRCVLFATAKARHPEWGEMWDTILPWVIVECERRLSGGKTELLSRPAKTEAQE